MEKRTRVIIYNKWEFVEGIIILLSTIPILLILPLSNSIMYFWFPWILGIIFGTAFIIFFNETGWYINTIFSSIILIGDGAFSIPLSTMSPAQIGIMILAIGIGISGNFLGFGTKLLLKSLKKAVN